MAGITFSPEALTRVRALWDQSEPQLSTAEIAAVVSAWPGYGSVTKNSIIGLANRRCWPARGFKYTTDDRLVLRRAYEDPSLTLDQAAEKLRAAGYAEVTPRSLREMARRLGWSASGAEPSAPTAEAPPPALEDLPPPPPPIQHALSRRPGMLARLHPGAPRPCEFPSPNPNGHGFIACGEPSARRNPWYCAHHDQVAFVRAATPASAGEDERAAA